MRYDHDAGVGIDLEVVADVAQAVRRLRQTFAQVVNDLIVLRDAAGATAEQREGYAYLKP